MSETVSPTDDVKAAVSKVPTVTLIFWVVKILATTLGGTAGDTVSMTLNAGYLIGTAIFLPLLVVLIVWQIQARRFNSWLYWATITALQTLGTALGDWTADTGGLGYLGAAAIFAGLLALVAALYYGTRLNRAVLFWSAFILTRPLGAAVGDFLDKPLDHGGLALSRPLASLLLAAAILALLWRAPQRPGVHPASS